MGRAWVLPAILLISAAAQDKPPPKTFPYERNLNKALGYLLTKADKCDPGIMSYVGWAFLLDGRDDYKPALDSIIQRCLKACVEEKHFNANWHVALSMLFLAEVQKRRPDDKIAEALKASVTVAAKNVEATGGWCHHKNYAKESDYLKKGGGVDLSMLTALMLSALANAKAAGVEVPERLIAGALDNLKRLSKDGDLAYGTSNGSPDKACARRAMAAYGLWLLGKTEDPIFAAAKTGLPAVMGQMEQGHACGAQNFFSAALGSYATGQADTFARTALGRLSQKSDGTVVLRNDGSKDLDFAGGHVPDTAVYAIVILMQRPKILEPGK